MSELNLIKVHGVLVGGDQDTKDRLDRMADGSVLRGDFKKARNPAFHRKGFALLNIGFDVWTPGEIDTHWGAAQKNFERFRKEVTILAGYGDPVFSLDGTFRIEAKSISFGSMDDDEFAAWYSSVIDVLLQKILVNYTRDDINDQVDRVMSFT